MDLQEGMLVKGIQYKDLHNPRRCVNVFNKYLHCPCVKVKKKTIHDNNINVCLQILDM